MRSLLRIATEADDLERMGLWPDEDRELELEAYESRPNDWDIDTP